MTIPPGNLSLTGERHAGLPVRGTGRLVEYAGDLLFDPEPPGPPHPAFGGQPEPCSSRGVRAAVVTQPRSSPPLGATLRCSGRWDGDLFLIAEWQPAPEAKIPVPPQGWQRVDPVHLDRWEAVRKTVPGDLSEDIVGVGFRQSPDELEGDDRLMGRVFVSIPVATDRWRRWLDAQSSNALVVWPSLERVDHS